MTEDAPSISILSPREIATTLYRRRYWLLVPFLACLLAATVASVVIRPVYQSSATLLVDSQQIPSSLVPTPPANYSDEQIAKIRQRILSRANLATLIRSYGLYPRERGRLRLDDVLAIMRSAITIDLVGSNSVNDAKPAATIAFNLSFVYSDPDLAQSVAGRLVTMFREEDKRLRTEQAVETAAFLTRRSNELRDQLVGLEGKRREIEARYAGSLPDQMALSAQAGSSLRAEVSRIDSETQGIAQQNSLLAARSQDAANNSNPAKDALTQAENRLRQLEAVYSDQHPDVVAAHRQVELATQAAQSAPETNSQNDIVSAEIAASNARIATLASRRSELVGSIASLDRTAALAPEAAYELNNLEREYDNLKSQYQDIREKQLEARVAANLQTEDKGERFSLVDAPSRPFEPIRPKRAMLIMTGAAAGLGLGLLLVILCELQSGAIHGESAIIRILGAPPISVIPVVASDDGRGWRDRLTFWRDQREAA